MEGRGLPVDLLARAQGEAGERVGGDPDAEGDAPGVRGIERHRQGVELEDQQVLHLPVERIPSEAIAREGIEVDGVMSDHTVEARGPGEQGVEVHRPERRSGEAVTHGGGAANGGPNQPPPPGAEGGPRDGPPPPPPPRAPPPRGPNTPRAP